MVIFVFSFGPRPAGGLGATPPAQHAAARGAGLSRLDAAAAPVRTCTIATPAGAEHFDAEQAAA